MLSRVWRKKPTRSEVDYEIITPDGPPCDDLEALQRGLARRSRDDEKVKAKPEDSDSSSSDGESSSDSDGDDESSGDSGDSSDSDSDNGGIRGGDSSGSKRASMADELASVTSEYTAGLVDKLAVALAKLISVDVGVSLEKLDEDISHMSGATLPFLPFTQLYEYPYQGKPMTSLDGGIPKAM